MSLPRSDQHVVVLHNPRCSKSRRALELLAGRGVELLARPYLEQPLDRAELDDLARRLGRPAREWVRTGESAWREAGLGPDSSEDEILDAMAEHPILIERPIVVRGLRAVVGRPPEAVLELLQ
jgi:arsenate reductase